MTIVRKSLTTYTFADGTCIPEGTLVAVPCDTVHLDPQKYPNPKTFDGERFARRRQHSNGPTPKDQLTTAAPDFLAWGYGCAVCPGRFFAAAVMKLVMTHIILNYDIRLLDDSERDKDNRLLNPYWWFGTNNEMEFMLRERRQK